MKGDQIMEKINEASIFDAIRLETDKDTLYLTVGMEVIIWTDETDFEKEYSGEITFVGSKGIEVEQFGIIPWGYIQAIEVQEYEDWFTKKEVC
jgi:hypothetical protein